MPIAGRPRNPLDQTPTRVQRRRLVFVPVVGQTPGLTDIATDTDRLAPGTIRRNYRQKVNMIRGPKPFDQTRSPAIITRGLRYKASSTYRQAGTSRTQTAAARPIVVGAGKRRPSSQATHKRQGRPVIRNRMTSFGSRVPALNRVSPTAVKQT